MSEHQQGRESEAGVQQDVTQREGHSGVTDSPDRHGAGSRLGAQHRSPNQALAGVHEGEPKGRNVSAFDCAPEDLGSGPGESGGSARSGAHSS